MYSKISVIIPTKNRPLDLSKAVKSILSQSRVPDQLIIVDQSQSTESANLIESYLIENFFNKYLYIHDSNINGLVSAKKIGVTSSFGDIISFLEDDIILEPTYFEEIENGFIANSQMLGCSGIIINQPSKSKVHQLFFDIFHIGIFRDNRDKFFGQKFKRSNSFIPCNTLSGGVSSWRKEVFPEIPFDDINGFHMLEDIDYSTRAADHFGNRFYINTMAHLSHFSSPLNRDSSGKRFRRKTMEFIIFYKKRQSFSFAFLSLIWLLIGLMLDAIVKSLDDKSLAPLKGYIEGIKDGFMADIKFNSNE
jgi:glycosyltransferase involved in cell wall biosynthesis